MSYNKPHKNNKQRQRNLPATGGAFGGPRYTRKKRGMTPEMYSAMMQQVEALRAGTVTPTVVGDSPTTYSHQPAVLHSLSRGLVTPGVL